MQQYYDLEINILSCLLIKPELMNSLKLEDKHFIKHQRLWQFMKAFYDKFKTFDIILMYQQCKDKFQIAEYLRWLVEVDPELSNFNKYQDELIQQYTQSKHNRYIAEHIFILANDLIVNKITLEQFYDKLNQVEDEAAQLYK